MFSSNKIIGTLSFSLKLTSNLVFKGWLQKCILKTTKETGKLNNNFVINENKLGNYRLTSTCKSCKNIQKRYFFAKKYIFLLHINKEEQKKKRFVL